MKRFFCYICSAMSKKTTNIITHKGVVTQVKGQQVSVLIMQASACSSCSASHLCQSSETKEKIIDALVVGRNVPHIGEHVNIEGTVGQGMLATVLAYVLPLFIIVISLFILQACKVSESHAAVYALLSLIPYYSLLILLRYRLARRLTFVVTQINNK